MPGPPPPGPALAPSPRERGMRRAVSAVLAACLSLRPAAGRKEISARGLRHGDVLFNRSFRQRHGACAATVVTWQTAAEDVVHSFYGAGDQLARQHGRFRGRTRFFPEGLRRGEAVLRLHDLLLDDAGNSSAWVFFQGDEEPVHCKISLWVSGQEHGSGWHWGSWMSAVSVVFLLIIVLGLCCWCFLRRSKGAARRCRDVVRSRLQGRHDAGSPLTGPPETRPPDPAEMLPAAPAPGEAAADAAGGPAAAPEPPDQADATGGGGRGGQ